MKKKSPIVRSGYNKNKRNKRRKPKWGNFEENFKIKELSLIIKKCLINKNFKIYFLYRKKSYTSFRIYKPHVTNKHQDDYDRTRFTKGGTLKLILTLYKLYPFTWYSI